MFFLDNFLRLGIPGHFSHLGQFELYIHSFEMLFQGCSFNPVGGELAFEIGVLFAIQVIY